jgi:hypothetical protein
MSRDARLTVGVVLLAVIAITGIRTVDVGSGGTAFLTTFGTFVAAWFTIAIFSFLYKDNAFYKAAEHIMVGLSMGYVTVYVVFQVLQQRFWDKLVRNDLSPDDVIFGSSEIFRYSLIIPAILGLLMLLRLFPKVAWISRWPMAILIGMGMGLALPMILQLDVTKQLFFATKAPINYLQVLHGSAMTAPEFTNYEGWQLGVPILIVGTFCALMYFFFSVPHTGAVGRVARFGVLFLMIGFGASFGYTVMGRLSLLIGRVLFLLKDWLGLIT